MRKFKILVHAENLNVYLDGELVRAGLYVTRVVSARTEPEARTVVIEQVKNISRLRKHMILDSSDPPVFEVENVEEIEGSDPLETKPSGLVFYKMPIN